MGAVELHDGDEDLVFVTSDAQLLRFAAPSVRPQGRAAGGMAGIKLAAGQRVVFFGAVDPARRRVVVTSAGSSGALPGTEPGSLKVTPYAEYPAKGRATGGVRATGSCGARTPWCSPGRGPAGPRRRAQRRRRSTCRRRPAARRLGHAVPGGDRRRRCSGALTPAQGASPACYAIVTGWGRGSVALLCKRFYLGPGSLIAEADNPSRRDQ